MDGVLRFIGHLIGYFILGAFGAGALALFVGALRLLAQAVTG